jgi:spore germination cell wall hydrolase CwlJ-like protein
MSDVVPSFNIAPGDSSSAVAQRRKLAMLLMQQGMDTSPIQHWTQGAARVAQALMGGYEMNRADQSEKDAEAKKAEFYSSFIPGAAAPAAAPAGNQRMAAALAAPSTNGKVYSNDEPSPLDPPSGPDRDMAIRTVLGEAGNQPQQGMSAVANVLRNRAVAGNFGGDSLPGVIQKPNQFEPWNTPQGQARMAAIDPNSQAYAQAGQAVDGAYAGAPDPTRGATHFYAPKAQAALGRPAPAWDNGKGVDIADHRFFGGAGTPPVMAGASPTDVSAQRAAPAAPQAPQEMDAAARIRAGLQSKDPNIRRAASAMAEKYVAQSLDPGKPTDDMREYAAAKKDGSFKGTLFDFITKKKQAGAIQNQVMIDQKGEGEFSKESGKLQAKRFNDLAEDAPAATQMQSDVAMLRDLGSKIGTGKEAEVKAALGPYAEALGIKVDGLPEIQAYEAIVNRVAPNLRVKGSGAQSDFELKNFLKSLPSIGNTPEGNELASRVLEGLYQNKMAAAEIGSKALAGEISRSDAEKQLRALPDPMKEWREFNKKGSPAATQTGPVRKFNPATGRIE